MQPEPIIPWNVEEWLEREKIATPKIPASSATRSHIRPVSHVDSCPRGARPGMAAVTLRCDESWARARSIFSARNCAEAARLLSPLLLPHSWDPLLGALVPFFGETCGCGGVCAMRPPISSASQPAAFRRGLLKSFPSVPITRSRRCSMRSVDTSFIVFKTSLWWLFKVRSQSHIASVVESISCRRFCPAREGEAG